MLKSKKFKLNSKQLLVICGPTATGKTSLAVRLAKKFGGELISADSRQVYKDLNIGTGKDLPVNSKLEITNYKLNKYRFGYHKVGGVKIWGYDLVGPKENFGVGAYIKLVHNIIANIKSRKKLPILVGGTGLYIKGIVDGIATSTIPPNPKLRSNLVEKKSESLFEILANLDPVKAANLNVSDRHNPRRLIRAIEIADYVVRTGKIKQMPAKYGKYNTLQIGLKAPANYLNAKISERVKSRMEVGFIGELKKLLSDGITWEMQSMQSLGYSQFKDYLEGKISEKNVLIKWANDEKKYAKRQMTWFKKDPRITWFDITKKNWQKYVDIEIEKWHNVTN